MPRTIEHERRIPEGTSGAHLDDVKAPIAQHARGTARESARPRGVDHLHADADACRCVDGGVRGTRRHDARHPASRAHRERAASEHEKDEHQHEQQSAPLHRTAFQSCTVWG